MYIQKPVWHYTLKTNQNLLLLWNGHKCLNTRYKNPSEFSTVYQSDIQAAFSSNRSDCIHKASFRTDTKYTRGGGRTNPGRLVAKAIKFCTVGTKICSLIMPVFFYTQNTCTEQKASDNSEGHRSLPNCGSSGWSVFLATPRGCLESGGGLQISVKFTKQPVVNKPFT